MQQEYNLKISGLYEKIEAGGQDIVYAYAVALPDQYDLYLKLDHKEQTDINKTEFVCGDKVYTKQSLFKKKNTFKISPKRKDNIVCIDIVDYIYGLNSFQIRGWYALEKRHMPLNTEYYIAIERNDVKKLFPDKDTDGFFVQIPAPDNIEEGLRFSIGGAISVFFSYSELISLINKDKEKEWSARYGSKGAEYKKNELRTMISEYADNHFLYNAEKKEQYEPKNISVIDPEKSLKEQILHVNTKYICLKNRYFNYSEEFERKAAELYEESPEIIIADYSAYYQDKCVALVKRTKEGFFSENEEYIFNAAALRTDIVNKAANLHELYEIIKERSTDGIVCMEDTGCCLELRQTDTVQNKLIPFYLPQFHITEENNRWWGEGFTEWTNVKKGSPQYKGHYQPRVPGELGYYDLVEMPDIMKKQQELAKEYGIYGFCYYYYWFGGKKLLYKPIDKLLNTPSLNEPFCICWANETWSRRWDGNESDILIKQEHNPQTDEAFIKELIPVMKDKRYIRVDNAPLFLIYRIELFDQPAETIKRWRKICRENGIERICIGVVQSFDLIDNRIYGADLSIEFPPHKVALNLVNDRMKSITEPDFTGNIYSYRELVDNKGLIRRKEYDYVSGLMLSWDNTARKGKNAHIFADFSTEAYKSWLLKNQLYTNIFSKNKLIFINAWNEWGEGTYLEPDEKYGRSLLEITKEILTVK